MNTIYLEINAHYEGDSVMETTFQMKCDNKELHARLQKDELFRNDQRLNLLVCALITFLKEMYGEDEEKFDAAMAVFNKNIEINKSAFVGVKTYQAEDIKKN